MVIVVNNKKVAVQSFDFSDGGFINLFVDLSDNAPNRKEKDGPVMLGGKVLFNRNHQELSFEHNPHDFLMSGVDEHLFTDFVSQNIAEITYQCVSVKSKA